MMLRVTEAVKSENDARVLTGRIGDTEPTDKNRRGHHVTHSTHFELGPVVRVHPTAELFQHIAAKLCKY